MRTEGVFRGPLLVWSALLLMALLVLGPLAGPAFAEDDDTAGAPVVAEGESLSLEALTGLMNENPAALWIGLLSKWGSLVIGVVLLIRYWLFWDKVKGGVVPAPTRVEPPVLLPAGFAMLFLAGAMFIMPTFVALVGTKVFGSEHAQFIGIAAVGIGTVPAAIWLVWRRRQVMSRGMLNAAPVELAAASTHPAAVDAAVEAFDVATAYPKRGPIRAFGLGLWTFCVSSVLVVPAFIASAALILVFGKEPEPQDLVQQVVLAPDWTLPVIVLVFGVLIAPFTEECLFRALLYPSFKRGLGGSRRAAILSAVIVSAFFAAIHWDWLALMPLFFLALVLTWVYERTASLKAVVIAHAINNFLSLLPLLLIRR